MKEGELYIYFRFTSLQARSLYVIIKMLGVFALNTLFYWQRWHDEQETKNFFMDKSFPRISRMRRELFLPFTGRHEASGFLQRHLRADGYYKSYLRGGGA